MNEKFLELYVRVRATYAAYGSSRRAGVWEVSRNFQYVNCAAPLLRFAMLVIWTLLDGTKMANVCVNSQAH
ncbi:hypothetical protein EVAR_57661_1 [Eumeta japonica]|uniref:Uncharacterized protein n=1 Tax=Eumeta variegata TaxID=151549 RepID=A0A4C1Z1C0_EUMVA|nr:hypothetical protein EVAR_57661_1 [Eumeta japonica]